MPQAQVDRYEGLIHTIMQDTDTHLLYKASLLDPVAATAAPGVGCTVRVEWPVAALAAEAAQEPTSL